MIFDTAASLPGAGDSQSLGPISDGGTAYMGQLSSALDGARTATLFFNDFDQGELFVHSADADWQPVPLQDCSAITDFSLRLQCLIRNSTLTSPEYDRVSGSSMQFSYVAVLLHGPNVVNPTLLQARFMPSGTYAAIANWSGFVDVVTPEPSTYALTGFGALTLLALARRRVH